MPDKHTNGGLAQLAIIGCLGLVAIAAVAGVTLLPEKSIEIFGFCSVICIGFLGLLKMNQVSGKTEEVHSLVNSQHGYQLKLGAELSRWKANETHDPKDMAAAVLAERLTREHEEAQRAVDAGKSAVN